MQDWLVAYDEDPLDPEAVEAFVNGFFDAIEAGEDVIQTPPFLI